MARIIVKTNDGRHTIMDEGGISLRQLDNEESAVAMLERLSAAIHDADRRLRHRRGTAAPKRLPSRKGQESYTTVDSG